MTSRSFLVAVASLLSPLTTAFLVPCNSRSISTRSAFHVPRCLSSTTSSFTIGPSTSLRAKKKDDDEDENIRDGMAEAFRELDALGSLEDDDYADSQPKLTTDKTAKGFQEVDLVLPESERISSTPEAEVRLYKDMYSESEKGETELYSDVLSDMGGSPDKKQPPANEEEQNDDPLELIDALERTPEDLDMFMNNALAEALAEARAKTPDELKADAENALDDEAMMKEIEEVFEKANKELLASLEDIRTEQAALAKASAEESAQSRMDSESENERRMEQAQETMTKMLQKVSQETLEVEKAVRELEAAQKDIAENSLVKLKGGGFVKQGALVGALLFGGRAIGEVLAMVGPNGELHTAPALIQGAIAIACATYFFLL